MHKTLVRRVEVYYGQLL